jgi:hypothetical protein
VRRARHAGCEEEAFRAAEEALSFCDTVVTDALGGVTGIFGDPNARRRILLDAHIDQIGLVVTNIDENGFLRVTNVGGVDCRTMPGSPVTVYGSETLTGIVCTLPPHLAKGDGENIPPVSEQAVDVGLRREEAEKLVSIGDRAVLANPLRKLHRQPHHRHGARRPCGLRVRHPRRAARAGQNSRLLRARAVLHKARRSAVRARRSLHLCTRADRGHCGRRFVRKAARRVRDCLRGSSAAGR